MSRISSISRYRLGVPIAVVATALAFAAPAAAGESDYLRVLQARFVFLSAEQLVAEGTKVCNAVHSGMGSAEAVQMVQDDLGVSVSAGVEIVSAAERYLDC
jgi:hypothetical protein